MPCIKCSNNKWRIGSGKCIYKTAEACETALRAMYAAMRNRLLSKNTKEAL